MKQFGFALNINRDSNTLVSHSESDWSFLRPGDLVTIDDDKIFYEIASRENLFFIQSFDKINDTQIVINGNYEYLFIPDDVINISYKEYELLTIKEILNKGNGYKVNDILNLTGGEVSINVTDNSSQSTLLKVEAVDSHGGITKFSIANRGNYTIFPDKINDLYGGHGQECKISVEDRITESRKMLERQIESVKENESNTIITLNYSLSNSIINGKISCNKWKAYLSANYTGETKRNAEYHVTRDHTPYLKLPLVLKNSGKLEEYYNYTIKKIDQELARQAEEIRKLKSN